MFAAKMLVFLFEVDLPSKSHTEKKNELDVSIGNTNTHTHTHTHTQSEEKQNTFRSLVCLCSSRLFSSAQSVFG